MPIRLFINLPGAPADTPDDDPHFAHEFRERNEGSENTILLRDVTPTVRGVVNEGRPINITLVPSDGKKIWYKGLYLALFTKA